MPENDLESRFFAFNFYADVTEDTSALAILQVKAGKLVEAWHPLNFFPMYDLDQIAGGPVSEAAREYLRKFGVNCVYALGDGRHRLMSEPEIFLGFTLHRNEPGSWEHYDALQKNFWKPFFKEAGIELMFYPPNGTGG
jgi:hypothetical protein